MRFDGSNWVPINRGSTGQVLVATASDVQWQNEPTIDVPSGVIVAWSGTVASIPAGWTICNGTSGTPDLRDRFVVGATGAYAVGASGGSNRTRTPRAVRLPGVRRRTAIRPPALSAARRFRTLTPLA